MLNKRFNNVRAVKSHEKYYYDILVNSTIRQDIISIYKIGYPLFYREVYYFWLTGEPIKVVNKRHKLNEVIKFKASMDKSKFILTIPLQVPYLLFA